MRKFKNLTLFLLFPGHQFNCPLQVKLLVLGPNSQLAAKLHTAVPKPSAAKISVYLITGSSCICPFHSLCFQITLRGCEFKYDKQELLKMFNQEPIVERNTRSELLTRKACSKLISELCLEGKSIRAVELVQKMTSLGEVPHKITYGKLIGTLFLAGDMKTARLVFDNRIDRGLSPDVITYSKILNGHCLVNCPDEAYNLFCDMKKNGISPDVITYTIMLDGVCKNISKRARDLNDTEVNKKVNWAASLFLSEMKEMELKPDVTFYTALIDSQCKSDNIQNAISLFSEMIEQGLVPDLSHTQPFYLATAGEEMWTGLWLFTVRCHPRDSNQIDIWC